MSRVWLIAVTAIVLTLSVAGLIVALVTSSDDELLPEDTPEGIVQRYLRALDEGDEREAYAFISEETRASCALSEFVRYASYRDVRDSRVTLEDVQRLDSTAVVTAEVSVFDVEFPLEPREYAYTETFDLRLEDGEWRLVSPGYWCPSVPR